MINIGTNTFLNRYIPVQSGNYGLSSQFVVDNTISKFDVLCSGNGLISFAFGFESGKIYSSGTTKQYFDVLASNTPSDIFAFSIAPTGFDVYINDTPILVSQPKATGNFEKIYFIGNGNIFTGTCNVQVFGNPSNLVLSNSQQSFVFPRRVVINTGVAVTNLSNVDSRILSATAFGIQSGSIIQSLLPILIKGGQEGFVPLSGQYFATDVQQPILVSYNNDYGDGVINSSITATEYSGAGIRVTQRAIANSLLHTGVGNIQIENTGTVSAYINPSILSTGLYIGYSGFDIRNVRKIIAASGTILDLITGDFDTRKFMSLQDYPFFFSDRITSSKNDFYLIQNNATQIPTFSISGSGSQGGSATILNPNHAGRALGYFQAKALGHEFLAPYSFIATYLSLPLRGHGDHFYTASGNHEFWKRVVNFNPDDALGIYILSGTGIDISNALASSWVKISGSNIHNFGFWSHPGQRVNQDSTMASGFNAVQFELNTPALFQSGLQYTILLTGSGVWTNSEVSGQRYINWQGLYHTDPGYPGAGLCVGPFQSGNGTGFCVSNTLNNFYFRGMGYQSYQPNPANYAPIGDDNFSNNVGITGFLGGGVVNLQRFKVLENFVPSQISLNFNSDDTDALYIGELHSFQGLNCRLNAMICSSSGGDDGFPDLTNIICSGSRSHNDFYQHHIIGGTNRNVEWVQERMFQMDRTALISGNKNYWLILSGTNYPPVKSLENQSDNVPVVRFSHNFVEPDLNYFTNTFSGKKMVYVVTGGFFYSGDPTQPSGNLFSSKRLSIDNWIEHRIFGDGVINSGVRKQDYEIPTTMCFELGINALNFNVWDTNVVSGSGNEYLAPTAYSYNKYVTDRLFTIDNPLPILLKAGEQVFLTVEYNGLQGYLDYGLLSIPEFGYTGFVSGFTTL